MDRMGMQGEDQIAGRAATKQIERVVNFPMIASEGGASASIEDDATVALGLLSDAAEAIRNAEDRAAETMARAQSLASSATQKVRFTQARIERAEAAKRQAEADLADCRAEIEKLRNELREAEARLADKVDELAIAEQRANLSEKRANHSEAALDRILHAIRTQLPRKGDGAAAKPGATA